MKLFKFSFIFLFFILISTNTTSQNLNQLNYLPLKTGNIWVYDHYVLPSYHLRVKIVVVRDTVINSHKYFRTSSSLPYMHVIYNGYVLYRVDTLSGNILAYSASNSCSYRPNEIILDSLFAKINNTFVICPSANSRILTDTSNFVFSGISYKKKRYQFTSGPSQTPTGYLLNIGLSGSAIGSIGQEGYNLYGCVIDGVVYGDTSLVGINKISSEVPREFSLSQNYPNPFNPATKIRFSIPAVGAQYNRLLNGQVEPVQLKIYDIIGNELQTLVNERLSPGIYEVDFDGTNYPSGIYYYRLYTGNYSDAKKMVLLK